MADHFLTLYSPAGEYLTPLRWKTIDCTLAENGEGVLTISLFPEYRDDLFGRDSRIAFHRARTRLSSGTGKLVGDTMWLVVNRARALHEDGQHSIVLTCAHPNALLARRVVAYDEGSAEADKTDVASDVIYDYIDENLVSATDTARNVSSSHFVLDTRPGPVFGSTVAITGSYQNLLEVIQNAAQSAAAQGVYIGYEVYVQQPPGPFRCRIYKTARGTNRGLTSNQTLLLDTFTARMPAARVTEDWSSVVSFVYVGGAGNGDERLVQTQSDATLIAQSPFGRAEHFASVSNDDTSVLDTEGYKVLRDYRPRREFEANVQTFAEQYAGAIYDSNYTWGDIVAARFAAPIYAGGEIRDWITYQFDVRVNPVHIQVVRQFNEYLSVLSVEEKITVHLQSIASS